MNYLGNSLASRWAENVLKASLELDHSEVSTQIYHQETARRFMAELIALPIDSLKGHNLAEIEGLLPLIDTVCFFENPAEMNETSKKVLALANEFFIEKR
jgi:hypothetical protein